MRTGRPSTAKAGMRIGKLTLIKRVGKDGTHSLWLCSCECGGSTRVRSSRLIRSGKPRSCGCEFSSEGQWQRKGSTYLSWKTMKARCYNPKATGYEYWGGRGITVCKRWRQSFRAFLEDMGERPEGMTLERKDVNGNYKKSNCCWATPTEQRANQRPRRD